MVKVDYILYAQHNGIFNFDTFVHKNYENRTKTRMGESSLIKKILPNNGKFNFNTLIYKIFSNRTENGKEIEKNIKIAKNQSDHGCFP